MALSKKRAAPDDLPALAAQLVKEPKAKANNLPVLVAALKPGCSEATAVLHNLRIFFIDCFDRGDLSVKPPPPEDAAAESVFAAWLHRQYAAYQAALLALLGNAAADACTQVAVLLALMECVRGERPGVFNNRLYNRLLTVMLASESTAPEVLELLIGKLVQLADVRYFTLASIVKIAQRAMQQQQQRAQPQKAAGAAVGRAGTGSDDEVDAAEEAMVAVDEAGKEEGGSCQASLHYLARTLHNILAEIPAEAPGADGEELRSWCGAAEVGIVAAANAGEGARQRKRQRRQAAAGAAAGAATGEQQRTNWASSKAQQRVYSDAWLAVLRMDIPEDVYKAVLAGVHDRIIPALVNPLLLADFLTATLDKGGLTGMLALNGIFLLVTRHGLEYPHFYTRLYQLLTPEVFHAKHRARFFSLADVFLASGMVPAYTAAAFVKRLGRLALGAPPAGALLALAFMHNIVRRHPATMQLLHRPPRGGLAALANSVPSASPLAAAPQPLPPEVTGGVPPQQTEVQQQQQADEEEEEEEAAAGGIAQAPAATSMQASATVAAQPGPVWHGQDVYDFAEPDPGKSRALESSLWELEALRQHYNPQVANFCSMLDKDLRDRKKTSETDISELLTASYASMLAKEVSRRLKAVPTAFYRAPPEALFGPGAAPNFAGWRF